MEKLYFYQMHLTALTSKLICYTGYNISTQNTLTAQHFNAQKSIKEYN